MAVKNRKILKIVLSILILIIVFCSVFLYLLSWNSSYKASEEKVSVQLIGKIQKARIDGTVLEINKDELNEIIDMYFKGEKTVRGVSIKGIDGEILNNSIKVYIPSSYKGMNFLLTSEGTIAYKDNKVIYKPLYFKIGKINLPQNLVINKLSTYMKGTMAVKDNSIVIDSSAFPLKIKSLEVKNSSIYIGMEKLTTDLEAKLKSIVNNINGSIDNSKQKEETRDTTNQNNSTQTETSSNNTNSSGSSAPKSTAEMDTALNRISEGLNNASASVSTGAQKAVISEMISVINSMKGNPNANPYNYAGSVRGQYNKLSSQEKAQLKAAVFSNINGSDITIVSNILGK
ncbi:hypothetical protein [Clostridium sp. DJ247]|uniref:hypothetical protein n=1 Tax=Clostridium sp. DJ247 TaxID=2726188 RepID=UPI0016265A34|nr:hypothetical protein [Clostridium sp. DJ247]MBC2581557.1 hypothetical protein [Clostridium sp. DJ247]